MLHSVSHSQNTYVSPSENEILLDTSGFDSLKTKLNYSAEVRDNEKPPVLLHDRKSNYFDSLTLFAKIFFILMIIVLLAFFVWAIADQFAVPKNKKVAKLQDRASVDQLEGNLPQEDLQELLEHATAAADYNLAVRLLFLSYLRQLIAKGYIEWRADKTNAEYLSELRGTDAFETFSRLAMLYERVWYGKVPISFFTFRSIQEQFTAASKNV